MKQKLSGILPFSNKYLKCTIKSVKAKKLKKVFAVSWAKAQPFEQDIAIPRRILIVVFLKTFNVFTLVFLINEHARIQTF